MRRFQKLLAVLATLLPLIAYTPQASAETYARATKVGAAKGLLEAGCKGGFIDIKGDCWKCPTGHKHDNITLPPTDGKVCKDEGGRSKREGNKHGKASGALGTDCPKDQWWSSHNGYCYSCDSGYTHDNLKMGNQDGVCWKDKKDSYSAAERMKGSLFCDQKNAFFDAIDGGTCWTCPANVPTRTVGARVDSDKACVSAACGGNGERPCLLTERIPSCNKGLAEDFGKNKCVEDTDAFRTQVCLSIFDAVNAKKQIPGLADYAKNSKKDQDRNNELIKTLAEKTANELGVGGTYHDVLAELQRIATNAAKPGNAAMSLFKPEVLCSSTRMEAKLKELGNTIKPNTKGDFFMTYSIMASLAAGVGVQTGFMVATDYKGTTGVYLVMGPQIMTNASIGDSVGVQFYPRATLKTFDGFGWGVGVSAGPPTKVFSGGVDFSFGEDWKAQGIGPSAGVGLGALPAEVSVSGTWAIRLWPGVFK